MTTLLPGDGFDTLDEIGTAWCIYTDNTDFSIQIQRCPETFEGSGIPDLDEIENIGQPIAGTRKQFMDIGVPDDGLTYFWRARHVRNGWLDGDPTPWQPAKPVDMPASEDWPECGDLFEQCANLMGSDATELQRLDPVEGGGVIHQYQRRQLGTYGIAAGSAIALGFEARVLVEDATCLEANGSQTMCRTNEGFIARDMFENSTLGENWEELRGTWTINQAEGYVETSGSPNILRYVGASARSEMVVQAQMWMSSGTSGGLNPESEVPHPYMAGKVLDDASCYLFGFDHGSFSAIQNGMYRRDGDSSLARLCSTAGSPWATETWGDYKLHVKDGEQAGEGATEGTGHLGCTSSDTTYDGTQGTPGLATLDYTDDVSEGVSRFRYFRAYQNRTVTVVNMPAGYYARITRESGDFEGLDADTKTQQETDGEVEFIAGNAEYYPYGILEIWDGNPSSATLVDTMDPTSGIWGGDRYYYAPDGDLPELSAGGRAAEVLIRAVFTDTDGNEVGSLASTGIATRDFSHGEVWGTRPADAAYMTVTGHVSTEADRVAGGEIKCVQFNEGTVPCLCNEPGQEEGDPQVISVTGDFSVDTCSGGGGLRMNVSWDVASWVSASDYEVEVFYNDGSSVLDVSTGLDPQAESDSKTFTQFGSGSGSDTDHRVTATVLIREKGTNTAIDAMSSPVETLTYGTCP